jgi:cellobiose phosphorylase
MEWVLGDLRHKSLLHVQTEVDLRTGALLARNYYNTEFPDRIVFLDVNDATRTLTGDRKEFIGRNGSLSQPAAMKRQRLSGKVGAGLDPCGAVQVAFNLSDGEERETCFRLGGCADSHPAFSPDGRQPRRARKRLGLLESDSRRGERGYA